MSRADGGNEVRSSRTDGRNVVVYGGAGTSTVG